MQPSNYYQPCIARSLLQFDEKWSRDFPQHSNHVIPISVSPPPETTFPAYATTINLDRLEYGESTREKWIAFESRSLTKHIIIMWWYYVLYYIQLATKVVEHLKDNLILSGIRENSWWVLGRKNHVIVLFEKVWKLTPANPPSTSRLWFLLSSLACLHDSSNFDFTPTGQSNQKSIKEWGKTEFCIHSPLGQAFVIWEVTLLYHRHRCNDYLSKSHIFFS